MTATPNYRWLKEDADLVSTYTSPHPEIKLYRKVVQRAKKGDRVVFSHMGYDGNNLCYVSRPGETHYTNPVMVDLSLLSSHPVDANSNSILDTAKELIAGSRAEQYGSFSHNAQQQADLWNAYLRTEDGTPRLIEAMDVPAMMVLVKVMRLSGNNTHQDSWVDVAGFAGLVDQVHDGTVPPKDVRPAGVPADAFRIKRNDRGSWPGREGWAWPKSPGSRCLSVLLDGDTEVNNTMTDLSYEGRYWERV